MRFVFFLFIFWAIPAFSEGISIQEIYTVQVYSSQSMEESKSFAQKFHSYGQPFLMPVRIKDAEWFRVYVGTFSSYKEAVSVKDRIKISLDLKDVFVRKVIESN